MNSRVVSYDSSLVRLLFTPFRPCNLLTTKTPNNSIHFIKSQLKKKSHGFVQFVQCYQVYSEVYSSYLLLVREGCLWGTMEFILLAVAH